MKLFIPKDHFLNPRPPRVFLCNTGRKKIGQLPTYDESLDAKWGSYSEFTFSIDRQYIDVLTGEAKINPLFDKAEGLRKIYVENIGYFVIQDPDSTYGENDTKTLTCFSSEYEAANKYLENFYINTGEIDSKEVIYLESVYGEDYTIDQNNLYSRAVGAFDVYESYYKQEYTDTDSYTYEQVEISDANEYASYDGTTVEKTLYIENYPNVRFYYPTKPQLSLLHLILEKIPEWKIGNVDTTLWRKERKFSEDRIAIYDFLMNEIQDTFKCVVEWDTLTNTVNFYEEAEDGINDDNTVQTRWDTDVYISRDNLASEINIKYSTDDIKTKLVVSGADDINIREVNLGNNYIMNLDYYHTLEWMEQDVFDAYDDYLDAVENYTPQYTEASQNRVAAYNKWNDLMNAVPAEGNVVLVGDKFEKLYCIKTPINTAYLKNTTLTDDNINDTFNTLYSDKEYKNEIDKTDLENDESFVVQGYQFKYSTTGQNYKCIRNIALGTALYGSSRDDGLEPENGLIPMLTLYHINEDIEANKVDNILLRLKNKNSDVATIRIYNAADTKISPEYKIQQIVVSAIDGLETVQDYTMEDWITGQLTATEMGLTDYTVSYIGVMGAYLVLAKDETKEENIEDYGVNLLNEKHETYTSIFTTQTEAMFSQEKYQCIASNIEPTGEIPENTRWLDTDSSPATLYEYRDNNWVTISAAISIDDQKNYENYQRYIDNFEKLKTVQKVLVKKRDLATYYENGFVVPNRNINLDLYVQDNDGILRYNGQSLEASMYLVAQAHFSAYEVFHSSFNQDLPAYYFTTPYDPQSRFVVYLKGTTPYVAYEHSIGLYQTVMNWITKQTNLENFFSEDQWIRLSPFIREDEFSDSNFLLTGYESEEERLKIYRELMDAADKELKTLCQPSLEFSMDMANILALPEFAPLINQFQLGNFAKIHIRGGYAKRARLLGVHLSFNDLSDFSCDFGNLVTTKSEIDKHAELLEQAVSAGKQVAQAAGDWQRAVDKSNKLEEDIASGLQNATLEIGKASGQSIELGQYGLFGRKLIDGTTDQYEDEQVALINNKLVFTSDSWKTAKSCFGKFEVDGVEHWGVLSDAVVSGYISGSVIEGGSLKIGGKTGDKGTFIVSEDGSVQILSGDGSSAYASKTDVELLQDARRFYTQIEYEGSTVFSEPNSSCTLTAKVFSWDDEITEDVIAKGAKFSWIRSSRGNDATWNANHANLNSNILTIGNDDIEVNSQFSVQIQFDDTNL